MNNTRHKILNELRELVAKKKKIYIQQVDDEIDEVSIIEVKKILWKYRGYLK